MDQVALYSESHQLQKYDASYVLENYFRLVHWDADEENVVLDVGCGDGDVTMHLLMPLLPKNVKKLVATDVSQNMLRFAKSKCKDAKVSFEQLDIGGKDIPDGFEEGFHHIFSFYCLHWVQDHRNAIKNLHRMLKPGGDMLLTFLARHPLFAVYETMSKNDKWSKYMKDFTKYFSPLQYSKDAERDIDEMLSVTGFTSRYCRVETRNFTYTSLKILKNSIAAVSPFISRIPVEERSNYISDFLEQSSKVDGVTFDVNNNSDVVQIRYSLAIVFASKPWTL